MPSLAIGRHPMELQARTAAIAAALAVLSACQSYSPLPLDTRAALPDGVAHMPDRPLTVEDIARLAVENNPGLRAARMARGVAEAQVLQAGLLPNPQFSGLAGFILGGPGTATGLTAGLGQDIRSLVTLSATRQAALAEAGKIDAGLLWQEWQIIGKARLLFVDTVEGDRQRALLGEEHTLFADRYARSKRALDEGNQSLSTVAPDLATLSDVEKALADLDRQAQTRQHDLDALLGLSSEVSLSLSSDVAVPRNEPGAIESMIPELPRRRPDLLALELGYRAQEEKLRGAILAQFPSLILGGAGGSDTTSIRSVGPSITIDLPIFNRNQGNIAIERATRQQLHAEYSSRLTSAVSEIRALVAQGALLQRQLAEARVRLPEAEAAARNADAAYQAGDLDERTFVDLTATMIAQRQTIIALEQSLLEQQVALATLTGAGMPLVRLDSSAPSPAEATQ